MVDRAETSYNSKNGILHRREWGEVQVSQSDTVTFDGFKTSADLLTFYLFQKTTGAQVTATIALNVATVTGAGTNLDCIYVAYGYKV